MTNNNPNFGFLSSAVSTLDITITNGTLIINSLPQGFNISYSSGNLNIQSKSNKNFIIVPSTYTTIVGIENVSLSVNSNLTSINNYPIYCVWQNQYIQFFLNTNYTSFTFLIID